MYETEAEWNFETTDTPVTIVSDNGYAAIFRFLLVCSTNFLPLLRCTMVSAERVCIMQCRQLWLWTGTGTHLLTTAYFYIVRDRKYQFIERHLVLVENHVISFERFSFRIFWLCSIIQWGVMVDTAERETEPTYIKAGTKNRPRTLSSMSHLPASIQK